MLERAPGIFEVELHSNQKSIDEIKIFLIPGKDGERSLMVDAGFRSRTCLHVMEEALGKLGITYDRLDIFLTHKHHDHCGLASEYAARGARLFMTTKIRNIPQPSCMVNSSQKIKAPIHTAVTGSMAPNTEVIVPPIFCTAKTKVIIDNIK